MAFLILSLPSPLCPSFFHPSFLADVLRTDVPAGMADITVGVRTHTLRQSGEEGTDMSLLSSSPLPPPLAWLAQSSSSSPPVPSPPLPTCRVRARCVFRRPCTKCARTCAWRNDASASPGSLGGSGGGGGGRRRDAITAAAWKWGGGGEGRRRPETMVRCFLVAHISLTVRARLDLATRVRDL